MSAPLQPTMGMYTAHRNHYLFSDHYLDHLLPNDPRWTASQEEAQAFLTWLQALYTQERAQLARYNESQLEDHWFKPILARLGHVYEGQASVPGLEAGIKRPDYVFFPDETTRQGAVGQQRQGDYAAQALAAGEVKRWDVPLSKKQRGGGASFENQNPSWQIDYYLRATGLEWGLLSNGCLWRLVHCDTSQRLSIYYEVDLEDLIQRGDAGAMAYFYLFFRQATFRPDDEGRVFLRDALEASTAYAVALEEDLEGNVYQALERLMQGFLDLAQNGLGAEDLRAIYENSLYLLYRLLFILYGESRGLLPLHLTSYRDNYSLDHVKREIAGLSAPPAPMSTLYWGRLKQLFQIINGENVALNRHLGVPRYNGGLFDPELHPFLDTHAVGDRALVEAIDLLSRRTTVTNDHRSREFVDYRTLGVRHLGSIYEGLLEYQPRYATEAAVAIRDRKGERWAAAAEVPAKARVVDRRQAGQVYLETDRGERKATGSYYTPQYIVEYIVQHTLGPLVEEALERVVARAGEARSKAARARAAQSLVDEILRLKVLDPAMGSGHFLVEATEYLALALATDPYVEAEDAAEEDLTYWKRRVVERCIYGVDLNPLAVELAKLSLWLATVAEDRPLGFLDHHLKCGNSLIGARVEDLGWPPPVVLGKRAQRQVEQQKAGQMNIFEYRLSQQLPVVMGRILEITEQESDSYDTVQAKEAADQAVQALKAPFQAVADLWTSAYFGHEFTVDEYGQVLDVIGQPEELLALPAVGCARAIGVRRGYFHWKLAFPEVFYDKNGQPLGDLAGFDAVIGNPPYVSVRDLINTAPDDRAYFIQSGRYDCATHVWDIYMLMAEQSFGLLRASGCLAFIVPVMFLHQQNAAVLRRMFLKTGAIERVVDLSSIEVFKDAIVKTAIFVVRKAQTRTDCDGISVYKPASARDLVTDGLLYEVEASRVLASPGLAFRTDLMPGSLDIIDRMMHQSVPFRQVLYPTFGLRPSPKQKGQGTKDRLLVEARVSEEAKPYVEGRDISRYDIRWPGRFVLYRPEEMYSARFPELFEFPKVLVRAVLSDKHLVATVDKEGYYADQTLVCSARPENVAGKADVGMAQPSAYSLHFVLAQLNSTLESFYFASVLTSDSLGGGAIHCTPGTTGELPIRSIDFSTPATDRQRLAGEARIQVAPVQNRVVASGVLGSDMPLDKAVLLRAAASILSWVEDRLSAQPEQTDVVHDLLAQLAEQMIEMNKARQSRVEAFWLDLEGVTDADAFGALRNKGKQESTLWKRAPCRPFVDQDSRSTRTLDESLGWNEKAFIAFVKALVRKVEGLSDLVRVYRAHAPAYRDLVARIAATDWLIDQIVYKLYRLTEDEIAIVEGRV